MYLIVKQQDYKVSLPYLGSTTPEFHSPNLQLSKFKIPTVTLFLNCLNSEYKYESRFLNNFIKFYVAHYLDGSLLLFFATITTYMRTEIKRLEGSN